jgi:hypothetical protein
MSNIFSLVLGLDLNTRIVRVALSSCPSRLQYFQTSHQVSRLLGLLFLDTAVFLLLLGLLLRLLLLKNLLQYELGTQSINGVVADLRKRVADTAMDRGISFDAHDAPLKEQ